MNAEEAIMLNLKTEFGEILKYHTTSVILSALADATWEYAGRHSYSEEYNRLLHIAQTLRNLSKMPGLP